MEEHKRRRRLLIEGRYRFSVAHLLAAIVLMFVSLPFVSFVSFGGVLEEILLSLVLIAGINAVGAKRRTQVMAMVIAFPTLLCQWLTHFFPETIPGVLTLVGSAFFVGFVIGQLFLFVMRTTTVNSEVLYAAICVYLLFGMVFAILYELLVNVNPAAVVFSPPYPGQMPMEGFTSLYFSLQMLTTFDFGDIMPASNIARMMAIVESTVGTFYLAILVARLVGLYSAENPRR
jgi:voltage-gated potassium channel